MVRNIGIIVLVLLLWLGNSSGPGVTQRRDRTGSPIALNSTCSNCHFGGSFDANISLSVLQDSIEVERFYPGEEYLLKVTFEHNGLGSQYGFQLLALHEESVANAGSFEPISEYLRKISLYNDQFEYVEHTRPLNDSVLYVNWTAPQTSEEEVSFYLAGVVTNDNSNTAGDEVIWLRDPLVLNPSMVSSTAFQNTPNPLFKILTNPVSQYLHLSFNAEERLNNFHYRIYDLKGRAVKKGVINSHLIDVSTLKIGAYVITIHSPKFVSSQKFLVQ